MLWFFNGNPNTSQSSKSRSTFFLGTNVKTIAAPALLLANTFYFICHIWLYFISK